MPKSKTKRNYIKLASKVILRASTLYPVDLCCPDCSYLPVKPVTGICGHTRCLHCINTKGDCPCGAPAPEHRRINVMVADLLKKMLIDSNCSEETIVEPGTDGERPGRASEFRSSSNSLQTKTSSLVKVGQENRFPAPPEMRFDWITTMTNARKLKEAVPHIAILAVQMGTDQAFSLRNYIARIINILSATEDLINLMSEFYQALRDECAIGTVRESDMECIICSNPLRIPTTAPCGHTFCRICLRRTLSSTGCCALCRLPLSANEIIMTAENQFITTALQATGRIPSIRDFLPEYLQVFKCNNAFPGIPYHILIFKNPMEAQMIQSFLASGTRRFGIMNTRSSIAQVIGTIVEVKDCVLMENGQCLCSTIGIKRFVATDIIKVNGTTMAEYQEYVDFPPIDDTEKASVIEKASDVMNKATDLLIKWNTEHPNILDSLEISYGVIDDCNFNGEWWTDPRGPKWLWWVIAILPEHYAMFKNQALCTQKLLDRLILVQQILEYLINLPTVEI